MSGLHHPPGGAPTNWIVRDGSTAHRGSRVQLVDGRIGVITAVSSDHLGWPVVHIDGTVEWIPLHPYRDIARTLPPPR